MQRQKYYFEKAILWVVTVLVFSFFLLMMSHYLIYGIGEQGTEKNCYPIREIEYYTGESDKADIDQVSSASDTFFSETRVQQEPSTQVVWLRLKVDPLIALDHSVLFVNYSLILIDQAYLYSNGTLLSLEHRENCIDSYIELTSDMDKEQYLYLKLKNIEPTGKFEIRVQDDNTFYNHQNIKYLWNMSSLGVLFAMWVMNVVLYLTSRERKYIVHSLFLFTATNMLFQTSGTAKITFGFNNINYCYIWTALTIISATLFVYDYFEIKKLSTKIGKYFQIFLLISFFLLIIVYVFQIRFFSITFLCFIVLICVGGFLVSGYTFWHAEQLPKPYIIAMVILIFGFLVYVLEQYGFLNWKGNALKLVFTASAGEAIIFTIGILQNIKKEENEWKKIASESARDHLTGLYNRIHFEKELVPRIEAAMEKQEAVSLLMLDIDHFKQVNDTFGHNTGDIILKELASCIATTVRNQDVIIRWGGEEFIIVLFQTSVNMATQIAEKVRIDIENHAFSSVRGAEGISKVTVSIGVTEKKGSDIDEWVKRADKALYRAKRSGRNCVQISYEVMSLKRIEWEPLFECNNTEMNKDHRKLIELINLLFEEFKAENREEVFEEIYDQILETVTGHFVQEERILLRRFYPFLEKHKKIHKSILEEALEIRRQLEEHENSHEEVLEFLADRVIMGHLVSEDTKFFGYL